MRLSSVITILLAVVLAGAAGFLAQQWLEQQRRLGLPVVEKAEPKVTIVVAAKPLRFGSELSKVNLREIEWPSGVLPSGAFGKVSDLLKEGERRLALAPIEPDELILAAKITGPGQRATLSSLIGPGMKAITIRVNDVNGVAGFVLPGDRIDVMLTRRASDAVQTQMGTEVLLQDIRVLGIDQLADERAEKARVVRAVTIEVTMEDAQRVVLASSIGALSLALRAAGSSGSGVTGRVTPADLSGKRILAVPPSPAPAQAQAEAEISDPAVQGPAETKLTVPFGITRSTKRFEYSVPTVEGKNGPSSRPAPRSDRAKDLKPRNENPRGGRPDGPSTLAPSRERSVGAAPQPLLNSWTIRTIPNSTVQR